MQCKVELIKKPEVSELAGEKVMIDFDSGKYYMLLGAANDIWDLLYDEITVREIVSELMKEYEIDETTCTNSVLDFLNTLEEKGFINLIDDLEEANVCNLGNA